MWRTPATLAGSLEDVPTPAARAVILALETSCDDTCAALVGRDGTIRPTSSPPRACTTATAASCPRSPSRHHLELVNDVVDDALRRAGATLGDVELVAVTQGPGLVGALLVGHRTAKGLAAAAGLPLAASTTSRATWPRTSSAPEPFEPPFVCLVASGGHTFLARVERARRLRGPRAHARRRGGRGVRQGRADARAALSRRPAPRSARPSRATRTPSPSRSPSAWRAWTSPSPG